MPVWPTLCDLGAPSWREPWFLLRVVLLLSQVLCMAMLLVSCSVAFDFLAIPIHLMMHKSLSLQLCWSGHVSPCRFVFRVCLCLFICVLVWFVFLVCLLLGRPIFARLLFLTF